MISSKYHVAVAVFLLCLHINNVKGGVVNALDEQVPVSSTTTTQIADTKLDTTSNGVLHVQTSDVVPTASSHPSISETITVGPDIKPITVPSDPDSTTTPPPTTTSTTAPTTKSTTTTTSATPPTTTTKSTTPATTTSSTPATTTSSTTPPTKPTSSTPSSTTKPIPTTAAPEPHHNRQFDGPSFIGGIVLASGLMAMGFIAFKFYKARTERNYHTL